MLRRTLATVGLVLVFVLTVQLAFTGVGQELGPHWSEPAELDELADSQTTGFVAVAADGGPEGGAVAWVSKSAGTYRVRVARFTATDGNVTVGGVRTVASAESEFRSVDVVREGDRVAVVWEDAEADRIRLAVDGRTRTVSPDESVRVEHPSVTFANGTPLVVYQEYLNGSWEGVLTAVREEGATHSRFGRAVGYRSPSIATGPSGPVVAWINTDEDRLHAAPVVAGTDAGDYRVGANVTLGPARTVRTMSGTGQLAQAQVSAGPGGTTLMWTDLGTVRVARLDAKGHATTRTTVGPGKNPAVGQSGGRWLTAYLTTRRASGTDVSYAIDRGEGLETGSVSRYPSNALRIGVAFAPEPAVAWSESGGGKRLLLSAYQTQAQTGPLARLAATPARFGFLTVISVAAGAVTVVLFPWVVGPLLAGFLLTTRVALDLLFGLAVRLSRLAGRETSTRALRERLHDLPVWVPVGAFVLANAGVLFAVTGGSGGVVPGIAFSHPLAVSALAAGVTAVLTRLHELRSPWKVAILFGYVQSVGLWVTALPGFL